MERKFRPAKFLFLYLLVLVGSFLLFGKSQVSAAELSCAIDMKAPPGSPSYLPWGAWRGPTDATIRRNDFKLNLACTAESVPESSITCWSPKIGGWVVVSSLCVGWDDTGTCDTSEPGNYSWSTPYPNDRTWNTPPSGTSRCISAWIRSRICDPDFVDNDGTKPGYRCVDSTSTHRTQTVSLWDGHFTIYNSYYIYIDNGNGTWTIRYWFGLSGGAKQGEPAGINRDPDSPNGTWCNVGLSQGPGGPELTCDLTKPMGTPVSDYTTNLYIWVAESRRNGPVTVPPVTPTPTPTLIPTVTPTATPTPRPSVTPTPLLTITPTPTMGTGFSCRIQPSSANVAPFGSVAISAVDATGSSNLRIVDNAWSPPSCGSVGYTPDGRPNATFWAPGNVGAVCCQGASAERMIGGYQGTPTGETAVCTQGCYTVTEKIYCCGVNNSCRVCNVGETPSDSCAGKSLGAWCGAGGPSYDLACKGLTSSPSPCVGPPGAACNLTASGWSHGLPYTYRFQAVPIITPTPALTFMTPNGYYDVLPPNYDPARMFGFKSPFAREMFLDKVEVILRALLSSEGTYIGAPVFAGILDSDGRTLLAEAKNVIPSDDDEHTLTFEFGVKPRIIPGRQYYLGVMALGSFGTSQGWMIRKTWPGPEVTRTRNFWFRDMNGDSGGFTIDNPTDYICWASGGDSTCSIAYKLPILPSNPSGYKINFELAAADDITYNCGGVPNGCFSGRATTSCSILGKTVTVTADPWWQGANGGDVYGKAGVISVIPGTAPTPYLIAGVPGIAGSGTALLETNGKDISSTTNWRITSYDINGLTSPDLKGYSYTYFYNKLKDKVTQTINVGDPKLNNLLVNLGASPSVTYVNLNQTGTVNITGSYSSGTAVVLVNGNLKVTGNVTVAADSALVFIMNGNVTVESDVTQIDGVYFAQGAFSTGAGSSQLVGNGAWYVSPSGQFSFGRDLGSGNSINPAEKVNFEPKYLIMLGGLLGKQDYVWQEVPG